MSAKLNLTGENDSVSGLIKSDPAQSIKKVACPVIFLTDRYRIEGNIFVALNVRLNDFLLSSSEFIPVTDAVVYEVEKDRELFRTNFISLKKSTINMSLENKHS